MITRDQVRCDLFGAKSQIVPTMGKKNHRSPKKMSPNKGTHKPSKSVLLKNSSPSNKRKSPSKHATRQSGRHSKGSAFRETDRIDLTRLTSQGFNNLLDGIEDDVIEKTEEEKANKKELLRQKQTEEESTFMKITSVPNIFHERLGKGNKRDDVGDDCETIIPKSPKTSSDKSLKKSVPSPAKSSAKSPAKSPAKSLSESPSKYLSDNNTSQPSNTSPKGMPKFDVVVNTENSSETNNENLEETSNDGNLNSSELDKTIPIFSCIDISTQTEFSWCPCQRCSAWLSDFHSITSKYRMRCDADNPLSTPRSSKSLPGFASSTPNDSIPSVTSPKNNSEKLVYLVKGCPQVQIPLSKKAALPIQVPDGDPQKMTEYLLDCIFTTEQLGGMTHDGKTEGTKPLDPKISSVLQVYISKSYDDKMFNFDTKLFKSFVNQKCYKAKRHVWAHEPHLVGKTVRAKLPKNVKKTDTSPTKKPGKKVAQAISKFRHNGDRRTEDREQLKKKSNQLHRRELDSRDRQRKRSENKLVEGNSEDRQRKRSENKLVEGNSEDRKRKHTEDDNEERKRKHKESELGDRKRQHKDDGLEDRKRKYKGNGTEERIRVKTHQDSKLDNVRAGERSTIRDKAKESKSRNHYDNESHRTEAGFSSRKRSGSVEKRSRNPQEDEMRSRKKNENYTNFRRESKSGGDRSKEKQNLSKVSESSKDYSSESEMGSYNDEYPSGSGYESAEVFHPDVGQKRPKSKYLPENFNVNNSDTASQESD